MPMLSEDDLNLRDMSADELDAAWDLWFDLAQTTNDSDPPYTHGVFAYGQRAAEGSSASDPGSCLGRRTGPHGNASLLT